MTIGPLNHDVQSIFILCRGVCIALELIFDSKFAFSASDYVGLKVL